MDLLRLFLVKVCSRLWGLACRPHSPSSQVTLVRLLPQKIINPTFISAFFVDAFRTRFPTTDVSVQERKNELIVNRSGGDMNNKTFRYM